jgi:hypothetical protein
MIRPIALLLTLAGILSATEVQAQHIFRRGHARQAVADTTPVHAAPAYAVAPSHTAVPPTRDYTQSALPARTYVGQGTEDFPFHGTPYGHPYDRYTFQAMAGSNYSALARYYDPPVK